jgi:hypothetical protein
MAANRNEEAEPTADAVWKGENENDSDYVHSLESFPLE